MGEGEDHQAQLGAITDKSKMTGHLFEVKWYL